MRSRWPASTRAWICANSSEVGSAAPPRARPVGLWLFALGLLPLARLIVGALRDRLGANPIEFVTRSTGTWTLVFLLATLAVTPLRRLGGLTALARHRRMLGLFAFFYGSLHVLAYLWWDQFFDWGAILRDVGERPFITAGVTAYLLMVPLALTSTRGMMRRLGRHWQTLHRLVYAVAVAGVVHHFWLVKRDPTGPLAFGAILALLLALRAAWAFARWRRGGQ